MLPLYTVANQISEKEEVPDSEGSSPLQDKKAKTHSRAVCFCLFWFLLRHWQRKRLQCHCVLCRKSALIGRKDSLPLRVNFYVSAKMHHGNNQRPPSFTLQRITRISLTYREGCCETLSTYPKWVWRKKKGLDRCCKYTCLVTVKAGSGWTDMGQ